MAILITILLFFALALALLFLVADLLYFLIFHLLPISFSGTFFATTISDKIKNILNLSELRPGEKAVDLGSGSGGLVIALAKAGAEAHGYEINPFLVFWSRRKIAKAGLQNKAFIHCKNFWAEDVSGFDVIVIFGVDYMMEKLEKKLNKELKPGSRVISNYFVFPSWKEAKKENDIYLYRK